MKITRTEQPENLPVKLPKSPPRVTTTNRVSKLRNNKKKVKSCATSQLVDKSTGRVDVAIALELRLKKGKTIQEIADHFGVCKQAVSQRLRAFMGILQTPDALKAYQNSKTDILSAVELKLVSQLLDGDKLKDASLNNVAYALQNVFNMNRLEQDKSTSNIALALKFEVIEQDQEPVQ